MSKRAVVHLTMSIKLQVPERATGADALNYVRDAIKAWNGGLDPTDPMFELNRDSVHVSLLKKEVYYA